MINAKEAREMADKGLLDKFKKEIDEIDKEIMEAVKDGHDGIELYEEKYLRLYKHIKKRYRQLGYRVHYHYGDWDCGVESSIIIKWRGL